MANETGLRRLKNGFASLFSEEVENGQRGKKLASKTSLRRLENGFVRLVSEG